MIFKFLHFTLLLLHLYFKFKICINLQKCKHNNVLHSIIYKAKKLERIQMSLNRKLVINSE